MMAIVSLAGSGELCRQIERDQISLNLLIRRSPNRPKHVSSDQPVGSSRGVPLVVHNGFFDCVHLQTGLSFAPTNRRAAARPSGTRTGPMTSLARGAREGAYELSTGRLGATARFVKTNLREDHEEHGVGDARAGFCPGLFRKDMSEA
jgi:hypothetical protein